MSRPASPDHHRRPFADGLYGHHLSDAPARPPPSDLEYVRSISPRLRSSIDGDLETELERAETRASSPHGAGAGAGSGGANDDSDTQHQQQDKEHGLARVPSLGPPPDGGWQAWLCVFGAAFVIFCVLGYVTGMGQLQAYYLAHQLRDYSTSDVSWIASLQITLTFGGAVISGRLFDAYNVRPLVVLSTVCACGSLVALAFAHKYYQIILAHAAFGIASSIVYSPATGIAAHWFLRRRGTAVAVIMSGAGLGGVIYPLMVKNLTDRLSFRNAVLTLAGIHFCLMLPGCIFMRKRLPNRPPVPFSALARPWSDRRYVFLVAGLFTGALATFSPYFNATLYARTNNASPQVVGYAVTILQAGNFVGRIASGPLADRLGTWLVFITAAFLAALSLFAFWVAPMNQGAAIAGLVLYGATSGAHITLIPAATATISPTHEIGLRLGLVWTVMATPMLLGPFITGELIGVAHGVFKWAGLLDGCLFTLATVLLIVGIVWKRGKRDTSAA